MNDQHDHGGAGHPDGENGDRLRLKGIVEKEGAGESGALTANRRLRRKANSARWQAASRQTWLIARLAAIFWIFAIPFGWPLGNAIAHWRNTGSFDGWNYVQSLGLETFLLAMVLPMLTLVLGYMLSRLQVMMGAAESVAFAARQFIQPNASAAENAASVGAVVRGHMDALNVGLDGALSRLAAVEAMIRRHVTAIETAGESIEQRATGAVSRVADERARLIALTEQLNKQADAFATAIAVKAQASIESLQTADDLSDRAQSHLEDRLARLDSAAQNALQSFNALSEALSAADETMRATTGAIDTSAAATRAATERAMKAAEAAAEAAARNAANVGASATRASQEAKNAADAAIEAAGREAERASRAAYEAAEREARRVSETANKILGDVKKSTTDFINTVAADAGRTTAAADQMSAAARHSAEASAKASAEIAKASEEAKRTADSALLKSDETAKRIEERNNALSSARAALEEENARLEALIDEQRKRADRLADAIASQTERLSKLAENQLREQEANAKLAEAQVALRVREEAASTAAQEEAARLAAEKAAKDKAAAEKKANETRAVESARIAAEKMPAGDNTAPKPAAAPSDTVLDLGAANRKEPRESAAAKAQSGSRQKLDEIAQSIGQAKKGKATPALPPLSLTEADESPPAEGKRDKGKVSWREILDTTDAAEPLDLAAASVAKPQPGAVSDAIKIISKLQNFTFELETRLYGDPPQTLRERFDHGDRNVFANRLLRLNETDVKRRIRMESGRDKEFERDIHQFLQGFERLLEDATTSETADEDLEEYLSSPLGRVYLLIGATVGYFA